MIDRDIQPLEAGSPADDPRMFRRCLGQFGTGVAIITTRCGDNSAGVTVNSFASVSLDPPLVLWSVNRNSRSYPVFRDALGFVINILSDSQIELSGHFSSSSEDKFAGVPAGKGDFGIPTLDGVLAHIECTKESEFDGGDHIILVGRVTRTARFPGEPLLFVQGRYMVASDHPQAPVPTPVDSAPASPPDPTDGLIPLLFETHHALSEKFDEHRKAEGLGVVPARIIAALHRSGGLSPEVVARRNYLGLRDTEDTLSDLASRGVVKVLPNGEYDLTDLGVSLREAIGERWLNFQASETSGLSQADVRVTSAVLRRLLKNAAPDPE